MIFQDITSQQLADDWTSRIEGRMREMGLPEEEVNENVQVVRSFCKTAIELMQGEPTINLPHRPGESIPIDNSTAHLILDLFLRGVNQTASYLRKEGIDWETRKVLLEQISWKIFNLAKLLVGLQNDPSPTFRDLLKEDRDLKMMMKHSIVEIIQSALQESSAQES